MNVFASCDSVYFLEHSDAFINSALQAGYTPKILVINPTREIKNLNNPYVQYNYSNLQTKSFYASNRFLTGSNFLTEEGLLITDIDCFFLRKMPTIKESVGLFLRPYERSEQMKVAAGIVWLSGDAASRNFIQAVAENIYARKDAWYVDQLALYDEYKKLNTPVFRFQKYHMDWTFQEDSFMWTGKGNRKYKDVIYLERKKVYEKHGY